MQKHNTPASVLQWILRADFHWNSGRKSPLSSSRHRSLVCLPYNNLENAAKKSSSLKRKIQKLFKIQARGENIPQTEIQKIREEAISVYKKYEKDPTTHINTKEFEADRIASNKVGNDHMRRALREVYKNSRKERIKIGPKTTAKQLEQIRKDNMKRIQYEIDDINKKLKTVDRNSDAFKRLTAKKKDWELKMKEAPKNLNIVDRVMKKEPTPPTKSEKRKLQKYEDKINANEHIAQEEDLQQRTKLMRKNPLSTKQNSIYK